MLAFQRPDVVRYRSEVALLRKMSHEFRLFVVDGNTHGLAIGTSEGSWTRENLKCTNFTMNILVATSRLTIGQMREYRRRD